MLAIAVALLVQSPLADSARARHADGRVPPIVTYRPRSTLFVVWSQSRFVNLTDPTLDLGRYVAHEMFLDPPTNVLLVKLNYWLSL